MNENKWNLRKTGIVAALIALTTISTLLIRIPVPISNGYFNIGDVFVILAGLWLGPRAGFLVGFIGPTIADAIGFPQFILATSIIKGTEGLLVGLIGRGMKSNNFKLKAIAASIGGVVIVVGYFIFEAYIYPKLGESIPFFKVTDIGGAIAELPVNVAQALIGIIGGLALWKPLGQSTNAT